MFQPRRVGGPYRRRFTKAEVYQLLNLGLFTRERVQLVAGELYVDPPMDGYQAYAIDALREQLRSAFGPDFWVRIRATLDLSDSLVPDPHVSVVAGGIQYWRHQADNPTAALLVAEVPGRTLPFARTVKAAYAEAGVRDYWVVNTEDEMAVEVYRDPRMSCEGVGSYASVTTHHRGEMISPLALPSASIAVDDLLPQ